MIRNKDSVRVNNIVFENKSSARGSRKRKGMFGGRLLIINY